MAQWEYNIFAERWNGHGYTYNPVNKEMRFGPYVVDIALVPQLILNDLEQTALAGINKILHHVPELQLTVPINPINKTFDQTDLNGMNSNVTIDGSFGSVGAVSCLIAFAVAKINQAQVMASGYHLDNEVTSYAASVNVIQAMTAPPLNGNTVDFYVMGGEVGQNTNPQNDDLTMDYSSYYPFFRACADQQVVFGGHKFPANPNGTTTANAAITTDQQQNPVINLWITNNY